MANADGAGQRLAGKPALQVLQLAFGTPTRQHAAPLQGGDTGRIVAAIFEALERIDELVRNRLTAENSDYPAQGRLDPPRRGMPPRLPSLNVATNPLEIKMHLKV
jgi:hypothetical protein